MSSLPHAKAELTRAERALESMKNAKSFEDYETAWLLFLNSIEKMWHKAERECQHVKNTFEPWQGKYNKFRRNDPLLSYIKQARDADNHSIQELVEKIEGSVAIGPIIPRGTVHIERIEFKDEAIHITPGRTPMAITTQPAKILAKAFINAGRTYTVPRFHRGNTIKDETNPAVLADLALAYYRTFLTDLEAKFF